MNLFRLFSILLCMLSLGACKEDYTYPNVLTELAEVETDAKGQLKLLTTDRGETFTIARFSSKNRYVADSLYRMLTVFEPFEGHTDQLFVHTAQPVFSEVAQPTTYFKDGIKTDPVDIQSIWRSGHYLNMILHVQTKEEAPHVFHFVDQGIHAYQEGQEGNTRGEKVLEITFYHDRGKDYEAFTSKRCFSIPLRPFIGKMKKGDKIRLHLNTYKEGAITREFDF